MAITGPAADKVTIFNPTISIGSLGRGQLTAPVFTLYIDPSIDTAALPASVKGAEGKKSVWNIIRSLRNGR